MPKKKHPKTQLSPSQAKVWELLEASEGRVVTHETLRKLLWPDDQKAAVSAANIVQVIITNLRRKLRVTITAKTNVGYCYWSK